MAYNKFKYSFVLKNTQEKITKIQNLENNIYFFKNNYVIIFIQNIKADFLI